MSAEQDDDGAAPTPTPEAAVATPAPVAEALATVDAGKVEVETEATAEVETEATAEAEGEEGAAGSDSPARAAIRASFAGRSVVGLVREHNEDNFVVANLASGDRHARDVTIDDEVVDSGLMFTVCDGMGGAAAGEVASRMAVDILHEAMRRGGAPADRDALARRLVSAVEEAGKRIFDAAQKERSRRGMGTTATAAVLADKILFLAEVGDSRGYLLRRGQLKQLTKDQSLVNQLIEAGHLTEAEAEAFEHSNIILQALGTSETVQVDLTFVELRKGDRLMMCSDGLSGLVHADTIRDTLAGVADPTECCSKLIEQAEAGGGHDNITVVIADFSGDGLEDAKDTDSFGYVQYPLPLGADESGAFTDEETTASGIEPPSGSPGPYVPRAIEALEGPSPKLWLLAGAVALAASIAVWFNAESSGAGGARRVDDEPANVADGTATPEAPAPEAPAAPALVTVNVHTDVEGSTLLVNGEPSGALGMGTSRSLQLAPGPYRFAAQVDGSPIADELVTVRGGPPVDVFLRLPSGTSAEAPAGGGAPEEPTAAAAAPEEIEPPPEAAPPSALAPAKPAAAVEEPAPRPTRVAREPSPSPRPPRVAKPPPAKPTPAKPAAAKPAAAKPTPAIAAPAVQAPPPPPKDIPDNPF